MRIIGLLLLLAGLICWLPTILSLVSPMWWHDWFGDTTTAPSPSEVADWISINLRLGIAGSSVGVVGIVLLILGAGTNHHSAPNEEESLN